jgi:hypothetical protein
VGKVRFEKEREREIEGMREETVSRQNSNENQLFVIISGNGVAITGSSGSLLKPTRLKSSISRVYVHVRISFSKLLLLSKL